jgi:hypothetical protein
MVDELDRQISREISIIKDIVLSLRTANISTKSIADFAGVGESAIKKFLDSTGPYHRKKNDTIAKLKSYITENQRYLASRIASYDENLAREIYELSDDNFLITTDPDSERNKILVGRAYEFIYEMLHVNRELMSQLNILLVGSYTCYRPGAVNDRLVISSIEIDRQERSNTLQYVHRVRDKLGAEIRMDGPVLAMGDHVNLMGDVGQGQAIELIVFSRPVSKTSSFYQGMNITMANNRKSVMGPVVLEKTVCKVPCVMDLVKFEHPKRDLIVSQLTMKPVSHFKSLTLDDIGG